MTNRLGGEFCLVCGAEPPLYGDRMCEPCLRTRTSLAKVPQNIPWIRCARCGIVEIQGKWENITDTEVWDELLHRHLEVHPKAEDINLGMETVTVSDRHTLMHIQIEGTIENLLFQEEHTMRARMANGVCLTCTRRAGNYFEATVQLRSSGRRLTELELTSLRRTLDDVLDKLSDDPMFFITSEGPVTGGYDVVLGSKGLAQIGGIAVNELQIFTPSPNECSKYSEDFSGCVYGNGHYIIYDEINNHFNKNVNFSVDNLDAIKTVHLLNAFYKSNEEDKTIKISDNKYFDSKLLGKKDNKLEEFYTFK